MSDLRNTQEYNDSHRLFVQAMLSRRSLSEEEAENIYMKICSVTESKIKATMTFFFLTI